MVRTIQSDFFFFGIKTIIRYLIEEVLRPKFPSNIFYISFKYINR